MYGHESKPSRIWSFGGVKLPHTIAHRTAVAGSQELLDRLHDQLLAAHRYRNVLVAQERARRARVAAALRELFPDLHALEQAAEAASAAIVAARDIIKKRNAHNRCRTAGGQEAVSIKELGKAARTTWQAFKARRREAFASAAWVEHQEEIDAWDNGERKRLRAESALYWGTYLSVEQGLGRCRSGPPPRFHRWNGEGKLAVQLQGGMTVAEAFAGDDQRFRLTPQPPAGAWGTGVGSSLRRIQASIRIGTQEDGRSPVWATVPVELDRPLPPNAIIKWVYLLRRRMGTRVEWLLQLVLAQDSEDAWAKPDRAADGMVAVDVGWRNLSNGDLRVACWLGSDGDDGEVVIPARERGRWLKVEQLEEQRDRLFNGIHATIQAWLTGEALPAWVQEEADWLQREQIALKKAPLPGKQGGCDQAHRSKRLLALERDWNAFAALLQSSDRPTTLPDWLTERTRTLAAWRSESRLAVLVLFWAVNRFAGDERIFAVLDAWRRMDKHLWDWQGSMRAKALAWRDHLYRNVAAQLRRRYKSVVIEDTDWRKFQKKPQVEEDGEANHRNVFRIAAVGRLLQCLRENMDEIECPAAYTTQDHYGCGRRCDFDAAKSIWHTCEHCGVEFDQDRNACRNLLTAASGQVVNGSPVTAR